MKPPAEPKEGIEYDFRQMPSRITAKRHGGSWILYEREPLTGGQRILAIRPDWEGVYSTGTILCEVLNGRTVDQAIADGFILRPLS